MSVFLSRSIFLPKFWAPLWYIWTKYISLVYRFLAVFFCGEKKKLNSVYMCSRTAACCVPREPHWRVFRPCGSSVFYIYEFICDLAFFLNYRYRRLILSLGGGVWNFLSCFTAADMPRGKVTFFTFKFHWDSAHDRDCGWIKTTPFFVHPPSRAWNSFLLW